MLHMQNRSFNFWYFNVYKKYYYCFIFYITLCFVYSQVIKKKKLANTSSLATFQSKKESQIDLETPISVRSNGRVKLLLPCDVADRMWVWAVSRSGGERKQTLHPLTLCLTSVSITLPLHPLCLLHQWRSSAFCSVEFPFNISRSTWKQCLSLFLLRNGRRKSFVCNLTCKFSPAAVRAAS